MDLFSAAWWSTLLAIILIDLVLAGDNAIVIALAARSLPAALQRKAIVWGTVGASVVRASMTVGVVWLLRIPGLMAAGAIRTIVVADALMGVDNGLGVAGAAHGAIELVIIGLAVSVPIVVFGSTVVLRLVERFPVIIRLGAAVLAWTGARMIAGEPLLAPVFGAAHGVAPSTAQLAARWALAVACVLGVLGLHAWVVRRRALRG